VWCLPITKSRTPEASRASVAPFNPWVEIGHHYEFRIRIVKKKEREWCDIGYYGHINQVCHVLGRKNNRPDGNIGQVICEWGDKVHGILISIISD